MTPDEYIDHLNLLTFDAPDRFAAWLTERHGEVAEAFLQSIAAAEHEEAQGQRKSARKDTYDLKNATYELSLDFSRGRWGDYYRSLTGALESLLSGTPERILDLGCDNGIIACYLAVRYPNAEVVGIDVSEAAVEVAREHAERLGISNASFRVGDASNGEAVLDGPPFDLVTSFLLFNEIHRLLPPDGGRSTPGWHYTEWEVSPLENPHTPTLRALANGTAVNASLVSMERLPSPFEATAWGHQLAEAGWSAVDARRMEFDDLGSRQVLPLFLAKSTQPAKSPPSEAVVEWYEGHSRDEFVSRVKRALAGPIFRSISVESGFARDAADDLFGETALRWVEVVERDTGIQGRMELREGKGYVGFLHLSTGGFARLEIQKAKKRAEYEDKLASTAEEAEWFGHKVTQGGGPR